MSVAVLGGGISGLSTAYYLSSKRSAISIYESASRVGGWINSFKSKNGTIFEAGPRTVTCQNLAVANTLNLIDDIGLESSIVPVLRNSKASKNRLIYYENQLLKVPDGFMSLFRINPPFVKPSLLALWKDWKTPKKDIEDDSIYNFVSRRLGEDYAENLFSPLVCGVFAGDAKEISVKALLEDFFNKEQKYGGIIRGFLKQRKRSLVQRREILQWSAFTFKDGLESLPIQLSNYLMQKENVKLNLGKTCYKLYFDNGIPVMHVNGMKNNFCCASHVFCSLPSKKLAEILTEENSFLKSELLEIPFVSVGVVNLEYDGDLLKDKAFGFLVPPNQKLPILGVSYDSCISNQEGKTVLTVMMGGKWFEEHFGCNPDENSLLSIAKDQIKKILNINEEPINHRVSILKNCIPQYIVGHRKRVSGLREYIKKKNLKLTLIGNSYDGVGINDAILSAKENVNKFTDE